MNLNYVIRELYANYAPDGSPDYVTNVHWTIVGKEVIEGKEYTEEFNINTFLSVTGKNGNFIPFSQLTTEIVTKWVLDIFGDEGMATLKKDFASRFANKVPKVDPTISKPVDLPWANR